MGKATPVTDSATVNIEKGYFTITVLKPSSDPLAALEKGEQADVELSIIDADGSPLTGLMPSGTIEGITLQFSEKGNGIYSGSFFAPFEFPNNAVLFAETTAFVSGRDIRTSTASTIYFNSAKISISNPFEEKSYFLNATLEDLKIDLTYPNGAFIEEETVEASLVRDGVEEIIMLSKNIETGLFEAPVEKSWLVGKTVLTIKLLDQTNEDEKSITANLVNPFEWGLLVFVIVGLFLAFTVAYFGRKMLMERAEKMETMQTSRDNLKGMIKRLRFEYFKRHITEAEYKKSLLENQQKLATLEKKLKINDLSQKKAVKKQPKLSKNDKSEVEKLVKILSSQKKDYSREQMYVALIQEKTPANTATKVVNKIYGKKL